MLSQTTMLWYSEKYSTLICTIQTYDMKYSKHNTHVVLKGVLWGCFGYQIGLQL